MSEFDKFLLIAEEYYKSGRLKEAESVYDALLRDNPQHAPSLYMKGMIAHKMKNHEAAVRSILMALDQKSNQSFLYCKSLGDIFVSRNDFESAIPFYMSAITYKPDYIDVLNNLGTIYSLKGNRDEALTYYKKVVKFSPTHALALYNIGLIYKAQNKIENSKTYFLRAISANDNFYQAYISLGQIFQSAGNSDEAIKYFTKAVSIQPTCDLYLCLAALSRTISRDDLALTYYQSALDIEPRNVEALNELGLLFFNKGEFEKSSLFYEEALKITPHHPVVISNLANAIKNLGQTDLAIDYYKKSLKLDPQQYEVYSSLLFAMAYSSSFTPEELAIESFRLGEALAHLHKPFNIQNSRKNPDRQLRIGYISPDFRAHAVNYFFEHLLRLHDRQQFEIYGYSNAVHEDEVTTRLKSEFDHWRDIRKLDAEKISSIIIDDQIDILIDLAGHTGSNNILVLARKPAPIQVTWLGYPATTGLRSIDYRITDHHAEPEGLTDHLNSEILWRLPDIFCCYGPSENPPSIIDHPPFEDNGYITFGCFNNFSKVTDTVLQTWKKIIDQTPLSRLLLEISNVDAPAFNAATLERFIKIGIPIDRLTLVPRRRKNQFVLYNKIDIALDPFPCTGGTTSMDTLWMGVPFITLAGQHFASRMGVSILTNTGLQELIAGDIEEYVQKAVTLATNCDRLLTLRHKMRDRVVASPMMNQVRFVKNIEAAYREMWQKYCSEN